MTKTKKARRKPTKKASGQAKITKQTYLFWYKVMQRIRIFEMMAQQAYMKQKIRGFLHLYIGQEAIAAGTVTALRKDDPVITAYRDHGLGLARGMSSKQAMSELYGKVTGSSKGKGGSMHFFDRKNKMFGGHGIVGGSIPLGAGIAMAEQYKGTDNVCVNFFGDGAVRQGSFHETFNMAMLWKLPVIFVCENNGYAMGTSIERQSNVTDLSKLGCAYDMPSVAIDGMSCEDVHETIAKAAAHCRSGKGPYYIEMRTYRYKGHSMSDPAKYRTKDELEEYQRRDPIERVKRTLQQKKFAGKKHIEQVEKDMKKEVKEAMAFADKSDFPDASALYEDIYQEGDYPYIKF